MIWQMHLVASDATIYPLALIWIGFVAGMFGALLGLGGGWLIVPALVAMGMPAVYAVGTSLVAMILPTSISVTKHHRKGRLDVRLALAFALPQLVAVDLGKRTLTLLNELGSADVVLNTIYLLLLGFVGVRMIRQQSSRTEAQGADTVLPYGPSFVTKDGQRVFWLAVVLAALGAGLMSGLLGIGGGLLLVPAIAAICRIPVVQAVAASLFIVLIGCAYGAAAYTYQGQAELLAAGFLVIGSVAGSLVGSSYANRAPDVLLRQLFAALAFCAGLSVACQLAGQVKAGRWILFTGALALGLSVFAVMPKKAVSR